MLIVKRVNNGKVAVGHPVDVATGTLFHEFEDHTLQGRLPLVFARRYCRALIHRPDGMFGAGWSSPFEMRIRADLDGYRLLAEDGETEIPFEDPGDVLKAGGTLRNVGAFHELRRERDRLIVTRWDPEVQDVVRFLFPVRRDGEWWPLIGRQDVTGSGIDVEHGEAGRIVTLRQRREGRGYRLVYSREGRLLEVYVTLRGGSRTRPTPAGGRLVLRYGYDGKGRLAEFTDALGQRSSYIYDAEGQMTHEVNRGGMVYRFRYDTRGRCVETTGADDFGLEALQFDDVARITHVSNSLGQVTAYHCNTAGQVEHEVSPLGNVTTRVYDTVGRLRQVVMPGGATLTRAYDPQEDLVQITSPGGMTTTYEYSNDHQVTSVIDPAGNRWPRQFDRAGRLTAVTNPLGETASYRYNAEGDLVAIVNPAGQSRRFEWDGEGNLTGATDWVGNRTTYAYDAEGRLIAMVDPLGQQTTATLDALGRSREVILPDGAVRKYGWNTYGQLTEYVDERGAAHRWRYGPCGLLAEVFHPEGGWPGSSGSPCRANCSPCATRWGSASPMSMTRTVVSSRRRTLQARRRDTSTARKASPPSKAPAAGGSTSRAMPRGPSPGSAMVTAGRRATSTTTVVYWSRSLSGIAPSNGNTMRSADSSARSRARIRSSATTTRRVTGCGAAALADTRPRSNGTGTASSPNSGPAALRPLGSSMTRGRTSSPGKC
jgi:YD repeat-containing protein